MRNTIDLCGLVSFLLEFRSNTGQLMGGPREDGGGPDSGVRGSPTGRPFEARANGMTHAVASLPDVTAKGGRMLADTAVRQGRGAAAITFSVDRILAPEFGSRRPDADRRSPSPGRSALPKNEPPVWVLCSRFSARPTAGPRRRTPASSNEDRRCRTAFTGHQVTRLRTEFQRTEYLSEAGRRELALELGLTEAQVKIWFQNARAKRRRSCGRQSPLAQKLAEAGLYNHTVTSTAS